MNIWNLLNERDNRSGILIRYNNSANIPEDLIGLFNNTETWDIIGINKNESEHVLIVNSNGHSILLTLKFDQENDWYDLIKLEDYDSYSNKQIDIGKTEHYPLSSSIILKLKDKNFIARNAQNYTFSVYVEIAKLTSYDSIIEKELQAEAEKKAVEEQLEMWSLCIEAEMKLLVDTPFECSGLPFIDVKRGYIDIPISPYIEDDSDYTLQEVKKCLNDEFIEQDIDNHFMLSYEQIKQLKESGFKISFIKDNEISISIGCSAIYYASYFKKKYYGTYRISYEYDKENEVAELTISSIKFSQLSQLLKDINDSLCFTGTITEGDIICNGVSVISRHEESKIERSGRIKLLDGKDIYFEKYYIGTLNFRGSEFSQIRITLPREKEIQDKIISDLKPLIEKGELSGGIIRPDLAKERAILKREKDAVNKVKNGRNLKNDRIKDFIFNSSKASPIPQFSDREVKETQEFYDCHQTALLPLNSSQQSAVVKALYSEDLCLLQGPPGTGKTTVIAELLWQHIRMRQNVRIMLTSQTNLAIDNALSRLLSEFANSKVSNMRRYKTLIKPLRIADTEKLSEEGMPFTSERIDDWVKNEYNEEARHNVVYYWLINIADRIDDLSSDEEEKKILKEWKNALEKPDNFMRKTFAQAYKESSNIMGMTCGKVDSTDFNNNKGKEGFDVVIMDEASKCTPPELIMPLCFAKKSIVIGDHRQLPPVMYTDDFREKLLSLENERASYIAKKLDPDMIETSLFKRLITNANISPSIKSTFNIQYRMHQQINDVIEQFYINDPGGLHCGLPQEKADSTSFDERESRHHGFVLPGIIDSHKHVLWIDVPNGSERREGLSFFNDEEVKVVESFLLALRNAVGFREYYDYWEKCNNIERANTERQIGVISFYAPQVDKLRRRMQSLNARYGIVSRTDSVDNFQGQERGIVIVSTVRTNNAGFARSPERLNVALSRARRLLVIVGNSQFFSNVKDKDGNYIYRNVIDKIKRYGGFISSKDLERFTA